MCLCLCVFRQQEMRSYGKKNIWRNIGTQRWGKVMITKNTGELALLSIRTGTHTAEDIAELAMIIDEALNGLDEKTRGYVYCNQIISECIRYLKSSGHTGRAAKLKAKYDKYQAELDY